MYTLQRGVASQSSLPQGAGLPLESHIEYQIPMNPSALLDPSVLQAARQIYQTYYEVHPNKTERPIGIAIDRLTYRGKLIFGNRPVLLPSECFIALEHIESKLR